MVSSGPQTRATLWSSHDSAVVKATGPLSPQTPLGGTCTSGSRPRTPAPPLPSPATAARATGAALQRSVALLLAAPDRPPALRSRPAYEVLLAVGRVPVHIVLQDRLHGW